MNPARIAELLAPFLESAIPSTGRCHSEPAKAGGEADVLSQTQLQTISTYIDLLLRWNARINLTAVRDPEQIVTRHFGESFFAARHLFPYPGHVGTAAPGCPAERSSAVASAPEANNQRPSTSIRLADVGSGAGFPGIPIKLWAPQISLTLIESNHKKATFLRELIRALRLTDVSIVATRAESLADAKFNIVTLRAVERFETTLPIATRLIAPSGRLALLISAAQLDRARSSLPNLSWSPPEPIPLSRARILVFGSLG